MGYQSTVQVIQRGGKNRQWYLICPAPLAQALEIAKGEVIEWVVEDKHTLVLKRTPRPTEASHGRDSGSAKEQGTEGPREQGNE